MVSTVPSKTSRPPRVQWQDMLLLCQPFCSFSLLPIFTSAVSHCPKGPILCAGWSSNVINNHSWGSRGFVTMHVIKAFPRVYSKGLTMVG